jgi:hypothetical protein
VPATSIPVAGASLEIEPATFGFSGGGAIQGDLGHCFAGSRSPACFTAALLRSQSVVAGAVPPGAPTSLTTTSSGTSVTLTWSAPLTGDPVQSYIIEAGAASGLANLANISTGSTATTFSASGVGNGTYYVRVRASNSAGISPPSNEAILVLGSTGCTAAPGPPGSLSGSASANGTIVLTWTAAGGAPTSYVIEAGTASGLSNLANSDLGGTALTFIANNIGSGTYYVRVRAKNACGLSGPSNEFRLVVSTTTSTAVTVTSISPTSGYVEGSDDVIIFGTGFKSGATVSLGGSIAVVGPFDVTSTYIRAYTQPHSSGTVDVVVTNPDGATATLRGAFLYRTIRLYHSISPSSGTVNGGTVVTVGGVGFIAGATVTFGDSAPTRATVVNTFLLSVTTPAHAEGRVDVVVTNPDGQSDSMTGGYSYFIVR